MSSESISDSQVTEKVNPANVLIQSNKLCFELLKDDLCTIFTPGCASLLHNCTVDHTIFCTLIAIIIPDSSGIPCNFIPLIHDFVKEGCGGCYIFPLHGNLRKIYLNNINNYDEVFAAPLFRDKTCFYPNSSLELLDFSNNGEHGYGDIDLSLQTALTGLNSLKVFNLSNNRIQKPSADLGSNLPKIEVFDLSFNILTLSGKYGDFLAGATAVKELNLAGNLIADIPNDRFATLSQMQTLNLSSNKIKEFSVEIGNLSHLSTIDLSMNRITSLLPNMIDQLNAQAEKLGNGTLHIDLGHNPLLCTCSVKPLIQWVVTACPQNVKLIGFEKLSLFK